MDLQQRRSGRQHSKFVMRLGVFLVVVSLVLGLVSPPKAEAFALTTTAGVVALVGGFLAACGLPFLVKGMNESGLTESVGRLLQEYLTAELGGQTVLEWVGDAALVVVGGKIMIPGLLAGKLTAFAQWVQGKYGAQVGENVVYQKSLLTAKLADGTDFLLTEFVGKTSISSAKFLSLGTKISRNSLPLIFASGYYIGIDEINAVRFFDPSGISFGSSGVGGGFSYLGFDLTNQVLSIGDISYSTGVFYTFCSISGNRALQFLGDFTAVNESLSLDIAESVTIPGELAEGQDLALDVGAVEGMEIQEILQGILDAILAGDLAASAEAVEAQPEQPPEEDIKDIDGLGLPALGAALITRFPFSIPWDIAKGIKLLAAPPKAPYFEVDFFAPIADRVGGWKGSTKIVLDFSQFEILGQLSRWTSTVGFCLMLAGATKRFIWTA